jgi:cyclopropane fatty-acyl-phospholipid synthase-like methyltransferase
MQMRMGLRIPLLRRSLPKLSDLSIFEFTNAKEYIDGVAQAKGFKNLTVITGDIVDYEFQAEQYDRVISIELFEHMKNYQ